MVDKSVEIVENSSEGTGRKGLQAVGERRKVCLLHPPAATLPTGTYAKRKGRSRAPEEAQRSL